MKADQAQWKQPMASIGEWKACRAGIVRRIEATAGQALPGHYGQGELQSWRQCAERRQGAIIMKRLAYVAGDEEIAAYLLVHERIEQASDRQHPAVLALHQTSEHGKDEPTGLAGDPELAYGLELAAAGYVVLVPDALSAGERVLPGQQPFQTALFYAQQPDWSMIGKMAADHRAAVSLLAGLPLVDEGRIAAVGHSLGGYNALFLAALDQRIRAVICSCGFSPIAGDPVPERWGWRDAWFTHFPLSPEQIRAGALGFDMDDVAAAIAPRSLLIYSAYDDAIFPHAAAIGEGIRELSQLYARLGEGGSYAGLIGGGGHGFPRAIRELAYAWLNAQLAIFPGEPAIAE